MKIDRALWSLVSKFAAVDGAREWMRRINVSSDGWLEATNGKVGVRLKLKGGLSRNLADAQFWPAGYEVIEGQSDGYKQPKASKTKSLSAPHLSSDSDAYSRGNSYVSLSQLVNVEPKLIVKVPTVSLWSVLSFCNPNPKVSLPANTDRAFVLFLSGSELTVFQRWQTASRLSVPCLTESDPYGNQFLCVLPCRDVEIALSLASELAWAESQFVQLVMPEPSGWNGGYSQDWTPGLTSPFKIQVALGDHSLFEECEIMCSPVKLSEESIEKLGRPKFPVERADRRVASLYGGS